MRKSAFPLALGGLLFSTVTLASAEALRVSAEQSDLSLTVYNHGLALVEDQRRARVRAGTLILEWPEVSASLRPETVLFSSPGLRVLEQAYRFDLISRDRLLEAHVGEAVTIARENPHDGMTTYKPARLLSANEGYVFSHQDADGLTHVEFSDTSPWRFAVETIPDDLYARPTLTLSARSNREAPGHPMALTYLTRGLSWKMDYVLDVDLQKTGKASLDGLVTLENSSGVDYPNAKIGVIAGEVNAVNSQLRARSLAFSDSVAMEAPRQGAAEPVGGYYRYELPERTSLANRALKQVSLLHHPEVSLALQHRIESHLFNQNEPQKPRSASLYLRGANAEDTGLGVPLPAGDVHVYEKRGKRRLLLGEARIGPTAVGQSIELPLGKAFDLKMVERITDQIKRHEHLSELTKSIEFTNASNVDRVLEYRLSMPSNSRLLEHSLAPDPRVSAGYRTWQIRVPAHDEVTLNLSVEYRS